MSELNQWISNLGKDFSSYWTVFVENGVKDLHMLGQLDVDDMVTELGIKKIHAKVIYFTWQKEFGSTKGGNLKPSVAMTTEKSKIEYATAKDDEKIDTSKFKDLAANFKNDQVFQEVLKYANVENVAAKALSILQPQMSYISKLQKNPPATNYRGFLSHVQKYSADLCRSLCYGLKEKDTSAWYDMTAGRLDAKGMAHGISICNYFVIVGTQEYFSRPWTLYELIIAQLLGKPIILAIEPDSRHGGMTFDAFVKIIPKPWEFLKTHEFLKVERRGDFWSATLNELHKRLIEKTKKEQKSSVRQEIADDSKDDSYKELVVSAENSKYWNVNKLGTNIKLHDDMVTITSKDLCGYATFGRQEIGKQLSQFSVEILEIKINIYLGVAHPTIKDTEIIGTGKRSWCFKDSGFKMHNDEFDSYGEDVTVGDIITIKVDLDIGNMICYKNGRSLGITFCNLKAPVFPAVTLVGNGTSVRWTVIKEL